MAMHEFIFSNNPKIRLLRHAAFWLLFATHFFIQNLIIGSVNEALKPRSALESLQNMLYFLPIYTLSTYAFISYIIPVFLFNRRYTPFIMAIATLLIANFVACYISGILYQHIEWKIPFSEISFSSNKYHAVVNGIFLPVMILGISGGIKLSKRWYLKQRENEVLTRQKIASELQLLKIQINPRFLFHSLHTVKQHILAKSDHSPALILQIADILSYILYESDRESIPLDKELAAINDYLNLEEKGSNEHLDLDLHVSGTSSLKFVQPLILLSIVQSGLEYFLEQDHGNFSAVVEVDIKESELQLLIVFCNDNPVDLPRLRDRFTSIQKQLQGVNKVQCFSSGVGTSILLRTIPLHRDNTLKKELAIDGLPDYEHI